MYYCKLKKKAIICIKGKDATSFVLFIILCYSHNVNCFTIFFLFEDMKKFYFDAPKYNIKKLKEKLNLYKLNRDINISEKKICSYFVFFGKSVNKILGITEKL